MVPTPPKKKIKHQKKQTTLPPEKKKKKKKKKKTSSDLFHVVPFELGKVALHGSNIDLTVKLQLFLTETERLATKKKTKHYSLSADVFFLLKPKKHP